MSVISHDQLDFWSDQTIFSENLQKWLTTEWDYLGSEVLAHVWLISFIILWHKVYKGFAEVIID